MVGGGGRLRFWGGGGVVGGVAYTWGSEGTRWIVSVLIGVALSWRH